MVSECREGGENVYVRPRNSSERRSPMQRGLDQIANALRTVEAIHLQIKRTWRSNSVVLGQNWRHKGEVRELRV